MSFNQLDVDLRTVVHVYSIKRIRFFIRVAICVFLQYGKQLYLNYQEAMKRTEAAYDWSSLSSSSIKSGTSSVSNPGASNTNLNSFFVKIFNVPRSSNLMVYNLTLCQKLSLLDLIYSYLICTCYHILFNFF